MSIIKEIFSFLPKSYVVVKIDADNDSVKYINYNKKEENYETVEDIDKAHRYDWIRANATSIKLNNKNQEKSIEFCVVKDTDIHNINGLMEFMKSFAQA